MSNYKKQGFSLIELLVVMTIIGVLASLTVSSITTARTKAADAMKISDIRNLQIILERYVSKEGVYPDSLEFGAPLVSPSGRTYDDKLPAQPKGFLGNNCSSNAGYNYTTSDNKSKYTIGFCLNGRVSDCTPGNNKAVPNSICD
ncbi:hypothetical protein COT94_01280 [Candidatus Falkowbacteria bacterium CG10_big_fil_rev_8_21_14_0_10_37_14]|uniref:Type II secretion system protein GspG C-terminal domain-containing protein n=1 Tax=Candidatus Falkowbacteria bacterium CG10_big_fil_rev_8_21_14_0_10_37_14 TaxID=1974561 RepID=A0A2M6WU39_9BACT|nr:type II secretion system protein [Candidatus Falkowbacteria bacterium]PIT96307.1 MAG: hypothetical protein COT94_01280 [Candidatus Falkowbacteria bacterium CG10_big_fil_rev_8_21_14_0_10_37_14]